MWQKENRITEEGSSLTQTNPLKFHLKPAVESVGKGESAPWTPPELYRLDLLFPKAYVMLTTHALVWTQDLRDERSQHQCHFWMQNRKFSFLFFFNKKARVYSEGAVGAVKLHITLPLPLHYVQAVLVLPEYKYKNTHFNGQAANNHTCLTKWQSAFVTKRGWDSEVLTRHQYSAGWTSSTLIQSPAAKLGFGQMVPRDRLKGPWS